MVTKLSLIFPRTWVNTLKNPKRLTIAQHRYLQALNINSENWLISKCTTDEWELVHRYTGQIKVIPAP